MLTEYETGFTILETSELAGAALLTDVSDRLESLLADGLRDASPISTEREVSASSGYAIIGADRLHPFDSSHTLRIQARLCTKGQAVTAQIRSRFISSDDNDPGDLTAGPPDILENIVNMYACKIGPYELKDTVISINDDDMADEMMNFIMNPSRKIPVLIITEYYQGSTAIEPLGALGYLLGLALVVRFKGSTAHRIGKATGRACYNGSMRFYWPGDSVGKYYSQNSATRNGFTQYQRDVIANANLHDLNGDFEQIFSRARTRVIREQRDAVHSQTTDALQRSNNRIRQLEQDISEAENEHKQRIDELLERLNNATESEAEATSDMEKNDEFRLQRTKINQMERVRRRNEAKIREQALRIEELEESLERAEADAAAASIPIMTETARGDGLQLTGNVRIDNITILNHAINIYRNPVRQYIIKALRKRYNNSSELCKVIERTMISDDDRKRLYESRANKRLYDGIYVGHFEHIVMDNRTCFGGKPRLSTKMSDVRQVRNAAAHPEYNGIDNLKARDGLNKVAGALREMGNNDYGELVESLLPLVR